MRRIVLCLGIMLAWPLMAQAAKLVQPTSVEFSAGAWVEVDATGKAHVVEMDRLRQFQDDGKPGSLADVIKARLRERIESWEFAAPTENGVAVSSKTHVFMDVQAYGNDSGGIGLRIESASTGMAIRKRSSIMPLLDELGMSNSWWMEVLLKASPEGRLVEARVVDSSLFHGKDPVSQDSLRLAKALQKTFKGYEFNNESVNGQRIAGEGVLRILCNTATIESDEKEKEPDFAAANSAVRLRTAVAGTVL